MPHRTARPRSIRRPIRRRGAVRTAARNLVVGAVVAALGLLGSPALADTSSGPSSSTPTSTVLRPVMLVMDYSGSMLTKDADAAGTTTRLRAAQDAVKALIDRVPDNGQLGLTVYGTTSAKSCQDITTVQPLAAVDKPALRARIDQLKAVGQTPIGASLLKAAESFQGREGPKSIVLVSDGQETCSRPAACDAARTLATRGIDLTIHTIGFRVSGKAQAELQCIAGATGGTYAAAKDAGQLAEKLSTRTFRAFQGYEVTGTPVTGTAEYQDAPELKPGQYRDQLDAAGTDGPNSKDGTVSYYRLGDAQPGQRLHLAVLQAGQHPVPEAERNKSLAVKVTLEADDGTSCGVSMYTPDNATVRRPVVAYTHTLDSLEKPGATCSHNGSPAIYAKVTRTGARFTGTPLPIELAYWAEPAHDGASPAARATESLKPAAITVRGDAQAVSGAGSFNDATRLEAGRVYRDTVQRDEMRFYRVHIAQGQRLSYRLTSVENEDSQVIGVDAKLFSPVREAVNQSEPTGNYLGFGSTGKHIDLSMRQLVDDANRSGSYGRDQYLAGDYSIVVDGNASTNNAGTDPEFSYELTVQVDGTAQQGGDVVLQGGGGSASEASDGATAAGSPTGTDASVAASSTPAAQGDAGSGAARSATNAGIPWLAGALGVVLLIGGGIWWAAARSRRSGDHTG
ncbi:hypothetical protein GCM10011512_00030 [Tersicoccus solisilvae]|uniref:VWFA domain-containing protein n=1 Tax=Tersicoccus solisilvae TaxID=1882339 RepID=A0ABQ1NL17_9MICC|nr:VWA domain-containing protein [Tersicoccus solisilvae]GGC77485.1 hypothetical protein GCM10011512_00030 [Tersicoccus solisilvae]